MPNRKCPMCKKVVQGRLDKKWCSVECKSRYHRKLHKVTLAATLDVDRILHRNRSILLELMGKDRVQKKFDQDVLDQKKFSYKYFTSRTVNNRGKEYLHIYDFRYMLFSDHTVLVIRTKKY